MRTMADFHPIYYLQFSASELLHATAGVCSVCLPDMEVSAIYNSLTAPSCSTAIVLTSPECKCVFDMELHPVSIQVSDMCNLIL